MMEGKGYVPLYINDVENGKKFKADERYWMNPDSEAISQLKNLLGEEACPFDLKMVRRDWIEKNKNCLYPRSGYKYR